MPQPTNPRRQAEVATQLLHAGRRAEAAQVLSDALTAAPADTHLNELLGALAAGEGRWAEAARRYALAARGRPGDHALQLTLARAHYRAGDGASARKAAERLAGAGVPEGQRMLGMLLASGGEFFGAARQLRKYMAGGGERARGDVEALGALGQALKESGYADEALALLAPHCERPDADPRLLHLHALTTNYAHGLTAGDVGASHRRFGRHLEASAGAPVGGAARGGERPERLRVGLISGDFRRHSVSCFLLPLLAALDRARFEPVCYSTHTQEDRFTREYESLAEFRRVAALPPEDLARQIASDGVHVLVDLAGYTWNHRLGTLARRPAPVQAAYLGYPATTGLAGVGYRLVDSLTDPEGLPQAGTEAPLRLGPCMLTYRAYDDAPPPNERPEGAAVVLGCLGATPKLNAPLLALFARAQRSVPGSVLVFRHLMLGEKALREDLLERAVRAGADRRRVRVEPPAPAEGSVMGAYHGVDISLDTFPYNGTTTLCESLWMGVPAVSLVGDRTASRMGLTILSSVGLEELAVTTEDGFVAACVALAGDHARRAALRRTLREQVRATLGEAGAVARAFEAALDRAWSAG